MSRADLVFELLKATLTGVTVNTEDVTVEEVVLSAFEAAELAADIFIERYGYEVPGDDPDNEDNAEV